MQHGNTEDSQKQNTKEDLVKLNLMVQSIFKAHYDKLLPMYITQRTQKGIGLMIVDITEAQAKVGYKEFENLPIDVQNDLVSKAHKHSQPESIAFFLFCGKEFESLVEYDLNDFLKEEDGMGSLDNDDSSDDGVIVTVYNESNEDKVLSGEDDDAVDNNNEDNNDEDNNDEDNNEDNEVSSSDVSSSDVSSIRSSELSDSDG